jgi:hypothetical protein
VGRIAFFSDCVPLGVATDEGEVTLVDGLGDIRELVLGVVARGVANRSIAVALLVLLPDDVPDRDGGRTGVVAAARCLAVSSFCLARNCEDLVARGSTVRKLYDGAGFLAEDADVDDGVDEVTDAVLLLLVPPLDRRPLSRDIDEEVAGTLPN